jgi:hypothetical protein
MHRSHFDDQAGDARDRRMIEDLQRDTILIAVAWASNTAVAGVSHKLPPITEAGSGSIHGKEKARLAEIVAKVNDLFEVISLATTSLFLSRNWWISSWDRSVIPISSVNLRVLLAPF